MRCIIHEVRRNSGSITTNFEENTSHFSQLEIIRLILSIHGDVSEGSGVILSDLYQASQE